MLIIARLRTRLVGSRASHIRLLGPALFAVPERLDAVAAGMSWEERTARREQEVEALKEALKILQNTDFGF